MKPFAPLTTPLSGLNLVEASAGTGKTYNITLLVARLVAEVGLPIEQVLVVTFTEAATAELRDAIRERLRRVRAALDPGAAIAGCVPDDNDRALAGQLDHRRVEALARVRGALRDFDRAAVFTIHGFCRRALIEHAFDSGSPLDLDLDADSAVLHHEVARDLWARLAWAADPDLAAALLDRLQGAAGLEGLVALAAEQPDLVLLGGEAGDCSTRPDPRPALAAARDLWRVAGAEVTALLQAALAAKDLSATYYKPQKIDSWARDLDDLFADGRPPRKPPEALSKFSAGGVTAGTRKPALLAGRTPSHPFFEAADALLAALGAWAGHLDAEILHARRRAFEQAREMIEGRKARTRVQSFSDLLLDLDRALADGVRGPRLAAQLARRFRAALIDEFQDTDRVQWRIFRRLFAGDDIPLFLIGDPKQSIYAFRGGDVYTYLAAAGAAGERRHTLDVNWRSDPVVLEAVNTLLTGVEDPFVDGRIGYRAVLPRPKAQNRLRIGAAPAPGLQLLFRRRGPDEPTHKPVAKGAVEQAVADLVADDLARLLMGGAEIEGAVAEATRALVPSDVAMLVPKNKQATWLQAALRRRGIPGVPWSQGSVFHTFEADELAAVIAALGDPADAGAVRGALATELMGLDAAGLARLREDDGAWQEWLERFRGWHDLWERRGFVHAIQAVFDCDAAGGAPLLARLMTFAGGERKVTNLRHLTDLIHAAATRDRLAIAGVRRWLDLARSTSAAGERERDQLELESDALAVKLITIHKSKGLEFPLVYLPYSWDGGGRGGPDGRVVFHDPEAGDRPCLDLGSPLHEEHRDLAAREDFAESARKLYVGLTRARHQCRVVWGAINGAQHAALCRLLHAPGDSARRSPFENSTDEELLGSLAGLERRAGGAVAVSVLEDRGARLEPRRSVEPGALAVRRLSGLLPEAHRVSSFSALVAGATASEREDPADGDPRGSSPRDTPDAGADPEAIPLAELPAGRGMGTCIHGILERAVSATAGPAELAVIAAQLLEDGGFDAARWAGPLAESLDGMLRTRLTGAADGPLLSGLAAGSRTAELEFVLPVAGSRPVTGHEVAAALETAPGGGFGPSYLDRVRRLGTIPPGWLRGFVDLVFGWQGRFYLVDYKSNRLGSRFADYARPALERAMEEHHYHLQYHLYAVAVDRFLRSRVPGYSHDDGFGGVFYLFLRGMGPGRTEGLFAARPPAPVIAALDRLFGARVPEGGPR
jgi:exodeoxyribonuclease V beta subunit